MDLTKDELINRCGEIGVERDVAIGELYEVQQQRDALLAACKALLENPCNEKMCDHGYNVCSVSRARKAIAKAEKQ